MKPTVFIDGQAGTTGLSLYDRLHHRTDIQLLAISGEERKSESARKILLNRADIVFLCLPDDAAIQAVALIDNPNTVVIDASTAHRTAPHWVYGLPELSHDQPEKIAHSKRIANPGCHATGFLLLIAPLVACGLLSPDAHLSCHSLTGYSGGGKAMIEDYQASTHHAPRAYALTQAHKHLPEMQKVAGLIHAPVFFPIVCDVYAGMAVTVPLTLPKELVEQALKAHYRDCPRIHFPAVPADGFLPMDALAGSDDAALYVLGNRERCTVTAVFDNLGKGAAGAAVQNMEIVLKELHHV